MAAIWPLTRLNWVDLKFTSIQRWTPTTKVDGRFRRIECILIPFIRSSHPHTTNMCEHSKWKKFRYSNFCAKINFLFHAASARSDIKWLHSLRTSQFTDTVNTVDEFIAEWTRLEKKFSINWFSIHWTVSSRRDRCIGISQYSRVILFIVLCHRAPVNFVLFSFNWTH